MQLRMDLDENSYDVIVERGALAQLSRFTDLSRKALIVTDDGVPAEYVRMVAQQYPSSTIVTVGHGEGAKSFPVFQALCEKLLEKKFSRKDVVVAVGGGVIGDLAGFAASAYMRGIGFINIPTTSLSQIDSSIGGKVAINHNGVKNCIGAFHQPELVVVDSNTLATLPTRHRHNGLVEAVKAGLLGDSGLFELFETPNPDDHLEEIILRSLAVKQVVVEKDEKEQGLRKFLNLGHTIGHGLEGVYGLEDSMAAVKDTVCGNNELQGGVCTAEPALLHGEAVAIGILPMLDSPELRERTEAIFQKLGIATKMNYDPDAVYEVMTMDKKGSGKNITIVRVREPGEAYLMDIPMEQLRDYL